MGKAPFLLRMVFALWCGSAGLSAQQPEPLTRTGKHFVLEVLPGKLSPELAARLADEGLAALEAAWPVFDKILQPGAQRPQVLRLHAAAESFRREERRLRNEKCLLETAVAPDGSEAHVLLWPQWSPKVLKLAGLPPTTSQNLVCTAAMQFVAAQLGAKADTWLAEVIGLGVLEAVVNPKRLYGIDPAYDSRRYYAEVTAPDATIDSLRTMVEEPQLVGDRNTWDERWSARALVAEQLADGDAAWARKLLQKWRSYKGATVPVAERSAIVLAMQGKDWAKAQAQFAQTSRAMRPVWQQSAEELWLVGGSWWMAGTSDRNANCYAVQPPPAGDFVIRTTMEFEPTDDGGPFRFQLDWDGESMLGVHFEPPKVGVLEWNGKTGKWTVLKEVDAEIAPRRPADVRLEVAGGTLRVFLDGRELLAWPTGKRGMHGSWGMAIGDSLVRLQGLQIEPMKPAKK